MDGDHFDPLLLECLWAPRRQQLSGAEFQARVHGINGAGAANGPNTPVRSLCSMTLIMPAKRWLCSRKLDLPDKAAQKQQASSSFGKVNCAQ